MLVQSVELYKRDRDERMPIFLVQFVYLFKSFLTRSVRQTHAAGEERLATRNSQLFVVRANDVQLCLKQLLNFWVVLATDQTAFGTVDIRRISAWFFEIFEFVKSV